MFRSDAAYPPDFITRSKDKDRAVILVPAGFVEKRSYVFHFLYSGS
ncbi:hypothetical protein BH24GEM2_BH24GEM2_04050 [soil metagenome]